MKTKFLIIFALLLLTFSNCNKEDVSSTNILISKTWKIGIVDINPSTNPDGELSYNIVHDCEKDDTYKFGIDGNLIINRYAVKCDQNELQTETLSYTIDRTTNKLVIDGINYTLVEETNNQIKYYATIPSGVSYSISLMFLLQ